MVLDNHLTDDGKLDLPKLRETIRTAVRALDNVIDINLPDRSARNSNQRHRPIGMGVMGCKMLYEKGVPFNSQDAVEFNDEFAEAIAYAYEASSDLAKEKGQYKTYEGLKWIAASTDTIDLLQDERGQKLTFREEAGWTGSRCENRRAGHAQQQRFGNRPDGHHANIMGTSPRIEPLQESLRKEQPVW